jgi:cobalt-zinc-cadmium efflux system protein
MNTHVHGQHFGHGHGHSHGHDHAHGHDHHPADFGTAFAMATLLNFALVAAQVFYGLAANSIALLADAGHNFGDGFGLLLAWIAYAVGRWHPTERHTYGFRSASILAALSNSVLMLVATGAIAWEAVRRLIEPSEVAGVTVMVVAALGIAANGVSAWLLMAGRKGNLNIRSAFAHLVADAAVSLSVVKAGAVIWITGWTVVDPLMSLVVSAVIVWSAWGLLRESFQLSMAAVPPNIEIAKVRTFLRERPGVEALHDLHIWAMSTTDNALTVHLVMPAGHPGDEFLERLCHDLDHRFGINHATFQIELGDAEESALAPDHTV